MSTNIMYGEDILRKKVILLVFVFDNHTKNFFPKHSPKQTIKSYYLPVSFNQFKLFVSPYLKILSGWSGNVLNSSFMKLTKLELVVLRTLKFLIPLITTASLSIRFNVIVQNRVATGV